jgi:hypothetical protein
MIVERRDALAIAARRDEEIVDQMDRSVLVPPIDKQAT